MTYTLCMAADQGIRIAEDGTAEVSMTDARANLTRLIRTVLEGTGRIGAFTERSERRAYVVAPTFVDQAAQNARIADALLEADPALYAKLAAAG